MSDANGVGGRHKLTRMQDYQLMSWVSCQRDRLQREHPTQREIAAEAAKELGFAVTRANVYGCLVYDSTVSSYGLCYLYFGGVNSVTDGTFTVVFNASGIFTLTL